MIPWYYYGTSYISNKNQTTEVFPVTILISSVKSCFCSSSDLEGRAMKLNYLLIQHQLCTVSVPMFETWIEVLRNPDPTKSI